jgi:putative transposase
VLELTGVKLIISDDHTVLRKARQALFPGVPWQRCQFHLQQNASQYVPRKKMPQEVVADIRGIFQAPNREQVKVHLKQIVAKYASFTVNLAN